MWSVFYCRPGDIGCQSLAGTSRAYELPRARDTPRKIVGVAHATLPRRHMVIGTDGVWFQSSQAAKVYSERNATRHALKSNGGPVL